MSAPIQCASGDGANVAVDTSMNGDEAYLSIEESGVIASVRLDPISAIRLIAQIAGALEKKEMSE